MESIARLERWVWDVSDIQLLGLVFKKDAVRCVQARRRTCWVAVRPKARALGKRKAPQSFYEGGSDPEARLLPYMLARVHLHDSGSSKSATNECKRMAFNSNVWM